MKLELKYLASYLPYDLKAVNFNTKNYGLNFLIKDINVSNITTLIDFSPSFKPILFPFSSLTKEITINGETFVPYDKIKEIYPNTPQFTDYIKGWMKYYGIMNSKCEYVCILKLFEWKLDVFGLIEEGLAEQVTEDFNPYK